MPLMRFSHQPFASLLTLPIIAFAGTLSGLAFAQDPPPPAPVQATTTTTTTTATPAAAAVAHDVDDGNTDQSRVVGRLGVGYFGAFDVPLGSDAKKDGVTTQVIGVRYWLQEKLGIDVGLGLDMESGSVTNDGKSADSPSKLAFTLKGGVPIALMSGKHYTFFVEPGLAFAHAGQTKKDPAVETSSSGNRFDIGAGAGAAVYFGFIGIPQLSLDATVGLYADFRGGTTKTSAPNSTVESSFTSTTISTQSAHQPWNIFFTNVAAIYYF
ncbi:MAG: hypothetical protein NVS3B20_15000 [Polyangiales bacterium]